MTSEKLDYDVDRNSTFLRQADLRKAKMNILWSSYTSRKMAFLKLSSRTYRLVLRKYFKTQRVAFETSNKTKQTRIVELQPTDNKITTIQIITAPQLSPLVLPLPQ